MVQLSLHEGEMIVDSMNDVEDTKGNNGDKGSLIITNLYPLSNLIVGGLSCVY